MLHSSNLSGALPSTGVAAFDALMAGTEKYRRWRRRHEVAGFLIVGRLLAPGTAAEMDGRTITIDPDQFRFIDLLHESRHARQIERAAAQGVNVFREGRFAKMERAWFERGAYEYEMRLALRFGFAATYLEFLQGQLEQYWKRSYQQELRFSSAAQRHFESLWR